LSKCVQAWSFLNTRIIIAKSQAQACSALLHLTASIGRIVGALKLLDRPLKPSHEKEPQREAMRDDYNVVRRAHVVAPERPDK
jgi:hypothetical protein